MKLVAAFLLVGVSVFCSFGTIKAEGKVENIISSGILTVELFGLISQLKRFSFCFMINGGVCTDTFYSSPLCCARGKTLILIHF